MPENPEGQIKRRGSGEKLGGWSKHSLQEQSLWCQGYALFINLFWTILLSTLLIPFPLNYNLAWKWNKSLLLWNIMPLLERDQHLTENTCFGVDSYRPVCVCSMAVCIISQSTCFPPEGSSSLPVFCLSDISMHTQLRLHLFVRQPINLFTVSTMWEWTK